MELEQSRTRIGRSIGGRATAEEVELVESAERVAKTAEAEAAEAS